MAEIPITRVITWLPVGGIERRLVTILPKLRERGWRPSLVCIRERGPLADALETAGIPVKLLPMRSRLSPIGLNMLSRHLMESAPPIVHSHMYRSNVPATIAARRAGVPVVFGQVHNVGTWESTRQRVLDRWLCRWRRGMIAVSRAVQQDVMANLQLPESRVPLLYNGIDTDAFQLSGDLRREARRALGANEGTVLILVPARLHPQKNPLGMLEAFRSLAIAHPNSQLAFAGDGKMKEEMARAVAAAQLQGRVLLLGKRDDMGALYNAADLVALPSFKEGFSNAVLEALACGKPMLVSDAGGNAEAVSDPAHGWVHPAGNAERLRQDLQAALGEGIALGQRAQACRARALEFSLDAMVEATHRLYADALGREP